MKNCLLKLTFDQNLYGYICDTLKMFPEQELEFITYPVQAHQHQLEHLNEQVCGVKQKQILEISTLQEQAQRIVHFLTESSSEISSSQDNIQIQLIPFLEIN